MQADRGPIRYLRSLKPPPLKTLTRTGETSDGWPQYAQRWALCHLLANNPNYGQRFRTLGFSLLGQRPGASYLAFFGTMNREIEFEYKVFLRNLENGYRVDLCHWDWKSRFRRHREGRTVKVKIEAGRGWQASRIAVQADRTYKVTATGQWQTEADAEPVDADGDGQIMMSEYAKNWDAKMLDSFDKFDFDADGVITPQECLDGIDDGAKYGVESSSRSSRNSPSSGSRDSGRSSDNKDDNQSSNSTSEK